MHEHGCVYFGAVEGTAALLARRVKEAEVVAYEDLDAEAIRRLVVEEFPVVVINDLYGGDLYLEGREKWRQFGKSQDWHRSPSLSLSLRNLRDWHFSYHGR